VPDHASRRQPTVQTGLGTAWGQNVRDRRQALGLSQDQLADLCGVTQSAISKIESGAMIPLDRLKVTISAKLGTTPTDLFPWPPMAELVGGAA